MGADPPQRLGAPGLSLVLSQQRLQSWLVAEFLILRERKCRAHCSSARSGFCTALSGLATLHEARYDVHEQAEETRDRLRNGKMEDIFQSGLHEYLQHFITANNNLSRGIGTTYNFPVMTMRLTIHHETRYDYDDQPAYLVQRLHLTPANHEGQRSVFHGPSTHPALKRALPTWMALATSPISSPCAFTAALSPSQRKALLTPLTQPVWCADSMASCRMLSISATRLPQP